MNDKELLKLAAKAAGIKLDKSPYNGGGVNNDGFDMLGNAVLDWRNGEKWNPLTRDEDAFRLAGLLCMRIQHRPEGHSGMAVDVVKEWGPHKSIPKVEIVRECYNPAKTESIFPAMRRAIVRAAAELYAPEADDAHKSNTSTKTKPIRARDWTKHSANERSITVDGRHFFALRCTKMKTGWTLEEIDKPVKGGGFKAINTVGRHIDTNALGLVVETHVKTGQGFTYGATKTKDGVKHKIIANCENCYFVHEAGKPCPACGWTNRPGSTIQQEQVTM